MLYTITEQDKSLLKQNYIDYKYRFYIKKGKQIVDLVEQISVIGGYTVNAESDLRRTVSLTLYFANYKNIESKINEWIGLDFSFETGIYNPRENDYIWYPCGTYVITEANTQYDAVNNSITISLGDYFSKLNGTRNGQIGGAPNIIIPAVLEDGTRSILRDILTKIIKQEGGIDDYVIDDIGEFYGMPENNPNWEEYRKNNPEWNTLPYDIELNAGCFVSDEINEITDLYPNIQKYFDVYNTFCCGMIPSCENNSVLLDNDFIQSILLATNTEGVTYDVGNIKNVTEVFGAVYDIDRMSEDCTSIGNVYNVKIKDYEKYGSSDYIGFIADKTNTANMHIQINNLGSVPIYYENTTTPIEAGVMLSEETYVFQYKTVDKVGRFYFLGQFQPHAICVLTASTDDPVYTKQYFMDRYNCKNIVFRVEPDNPFVIQKLGIIPDVKTGDTYENIISDSVAIENAIYDNLKTSSWNDIVTITTKYVPWLDVYVKVSYKKQQDNIINPYIIKNISHNLDGAPTSTITMYRFHPLYYDYSIPR